VRRTAAAPSLRSALSAIVLLALPMCASAQELEPGAYWPIPRGLNIFTVVNNFNWGDVAFDPSAPIDEARAQINTTVFAFTRAVNLAGRSANLGVVVPIVGGHVEGRYLGEPAEVHRFGLGDPRVRVAVNLYGAPSMTPKEFGPYEQRTIVGVSMTVAPPLGRYDSAKLINLGTRRCKRTMWLAADANYFTGGRTTIGGKQNIDLQRNSRVGATFSRAISRSQAIRMSEPWSVHDHRRRFHLGCPRL
jgi:hypothetical protein